MSNFLRDVLVIAVLFNSVMLGHRVDGLLKAVDDLYPSTSADENPLTWREHQVLSGMANGMIDKSIAMELGVSRATVEGYVRRMRIKLGVETRAHLVATAVRRGLLDLHQ